MQLSKEQKELVRTLLGAHARHVGTMFDQFVQFRVSIYRIQDEIRQKGAQGGWPKGGDCVPCPDRGQDFSRTPAEADFSAWNPSKIKLLG